MVSVDLRPADLQSETLGILALRFLLSTYLGIVTTSCNSSILWWRQVDSGSSVAGQSTWTVELQLQ